MIQVMNACFPRTIRGATRCWTGGARRSVLARAGARREHAGVSAHSVDKAVAGTGARTAR
jgi:hypothetical protein